MGFFRAQDMGNTDLFYTPCVPYVPVSVEARRGGTLGNDVFYRGSVTIHLAPGSKDPRDGSLRWAITKSLSQATNAPPEDVYLPRGLTIKDGSTILKVGAGEGGAELQDGRERCRRNVSGLYLPGRTFH